MRWSRPARRWPNSAACWDFEPKSDQREHIVSKHLPAARAAKQAIVAGLLLSASCLARADVQPVMPPVVAPALVKPDAQGQKPQAVVVIAGYRYDDILWENDRTAHRIYGHALEAAEPPSSSGIDAWGKNVRWPYMERQLKGGGSQHDYHGEGLDFYDVDTSRGAGGLGIWQDNKLWLSRNWKTCKILKNGPQVAAFQVEY